MKWFSDCKTIEELKRKYHALVLKYHPDRGGDLQTMQEINSEFDRLAKILKNRHEKSSTKTENNYEEKEAYSGESFDSEKFREIISKLIRFDGVKIEIIGTWIWVTGNTYLYREQLKELSFRWSKSKKAWYWGEYLFHKTKGFYTLEQLRNMHGSSVVDVNQKQYALKA